jgi:hypothetical protein
MKKLIKNYTTAVPVEKTLAEIQKLLVENGARAIALEYDQASKIKDIFFKIQLQNKELPFRLPTKPEKVFAALHKHAPSYQQDRYRQQWQEEAERIAWRVCKSWLKAQITLINLEQTALTEVFLLYLVVGENNESLYEVMKEKQFLLPGGTT